MTITRHDLEPSFKFQVANEPGGEHLNKCFDCGTCAAICPVSRAEPNFDPRRLLHMVRFGLKERLLASELLWYCTHCDSCSLVCPQEVAFSSIVDVLRDLSLSSGCAPGKELKPYGTAPCKASCPAHISIPGFIGAVAEGRHLEGLKLIKEQMPFPGICGRICPHPCEENCNRGKFDQPVAIESLKRYLADEDLLSEDPYVPKKQEDRAEKVAVVGAGPAGLTVAYYLAIKGYNVTVFDRLPVPGGMMAAAIPSFRLPRHVIGSEIDVIRRLGVEFRLNVDVGKDVSLADLQKEYHAVFLGLGCHKSLPLGIPGEGESHGLMDGLSFLREINMGNNLHLQGRVVVIGGGNTAVDCARVAMRMRFHSVSLVYRRTREEMPAHPWEVEEALEEGIHLQYLAAPVRIIAENGKLSGIQCIQMKLGEPDESGRRRPVPVEGSEFLIKAEVAISAIGQAPDLKGLSEKGFPDVSRKGLIISDPLKGTTNVPGVFSGGDVVSGPRTVVEAVAFGKRAAGSIDKYLKGEETSRDDEPFWTGLHFLPQDSRPMPREEEPLLSPAERKRTFKEIRPGLNKEQAMNEAGRCFRICGIQAPEAKE